jgi:hypothetical protein
MSILLPHTNQSFQIGEKIIPPSQSLCTLIGDTVDYHDNKTVLIKRGWITHMKIPGIIVFISKFRYGYNKSGTPFYMFYPTLPYLPPMIVACRGNQESNMLAIVEFNSWSNPSEHPRANLVRTIGTINDTTSELTAILSRIDSPTYKKILESHHIPPQIYISPSSHPTFNIDPTGCIDVDDVLTIFPLDPEEETWQIDISIADVSHFIPLDSEIDLIARQKAATGYTDISRITMLPPSLEKEISLTQNTVRPTITLSIVWHQPSETITKTTWSKRILRNSHSFSYEDAVITHPIFHREFSVLSRLSGSTDSHVWIEYVMRLYNTEAAKLIRDTPRAIFRKEIPPPTDIPDDTPHNIRFLYYQSSTYCWDNTGYTHASSPIRRYADLAVQRTIVSIIDGTPPPDYQVDLPYWLNYRQKIIRQAERDIIFYRKVTVGLNRIETAIVAAIKMDGDMAKIKLWIPEILHSITVNYRMDGGDIVSKDGLARRSIALYTVTPLTILWDSTRIGRKRFVYSLFD